MTDFGYVCAHSLDQAIQLLNEPGCRSRVLAGGTDLMVEARAGSVHFDRVVDVTRVPELRVVVADGANGDRVLVGAAVPFTQILRHERLRARAPLLVEACGYIGSPQIRNAGTLGGNVINAAACADSVPALVCLEAEAIIVSPSGETRCRVTDLITNTHRTELPAGALVRAFSFDAQPAGSRSAFERIGRRQAMAIARLSLAALGACGPTGQITTMRLVPGASFARFRRVTVVEEMLLGQVPSAELFVAAGRRMAEVFMAESGGRWSAEWKEKALATLTERALQRVVGGSNEN